jgi:hypothetical protein
MSFLERLGYVTKGRHAEVLRERDALKRSVSELEDTIEVLEAEKNWLMSRVAFLKMVVPSVRKIKNIGPRTAQKLETIGIKNIIDLIEASPEKIAEGTGLPEERIQKMINKATKLIKRQTWWELHL